MKMQEGKGRDYLGDTGGHGRVILEWMGELRLDSIYRDHCWTHVNMGSMGNFFTISHKLLKKKPATRSQLKR
jgi:hypothetical protein